MSSHRKALAVILFFWLPAMILTLSQETGESRDLRLGEEAREDIVREMAGRIRAGESLEVYVDPDALPVAGEEEIYDFPADYFDPSASSGNIGTFSASGKTGTGRIVQGEHADGGSSSEGRASRPKTHRSTAHTGRSRSLRSAANSRYGRVPGKSNSAMVPDACRDLLRQEPPGI